MVIREESNATVMVIESADPVVSGPAPQWQLPRLSDGDRLIGGVAAGTAREIGVDPLWVRLAFVLLFAVGGWGALLYVAAWGAISLATYRLGEPEHPPVPKARDVGRRWLGFGLVVCGLVIAAAGLGGLSAGVLWPVALMGGGVSLALGRIEPAGSRLPAWLIAVLGVCVAAFGGVGIVSAMGLGPSTAPAFGALAITIGLAVLSAPWWFRLVSDLDAERQARARSDERAEVAAHLHDSVLQTLALIQKGEDPQRMVQLARRQERELRNWLDPDRASRTGGSLRGQLDALASEVEDLYSTPVEVVVVGDALVDEPLEAMVRACREAVVNAAKHSGAARIDLYAEIGPDQVEIFVRDLGIGFDLAAVDADRRGLSESIVGRMFRAGGSAQIHALPGDGTEVELRLDRPRDGKQEAS